MNIRQKQIYNFINQKKIVIIKELIEIFKVSEATIRRDLTYLEEKNLIYRTHGGAAKKDFSRNFENNIATKKKEYILEKNKVAKYISENFIKNGQTIFLDSGTSTYEIIDYLQDKKVTVVTNSAYHLTKLIENKIHTIILGGILKHSTYAVVGLNALNQLENYSFDACFIGCNGIDHDFGLSTADEAEAYIKKIALKNSQYKYVLADESKFKQRKFQKFANLDDVIIISYKVNPDFKNYTNIIEVIEEER